MGAKTGLNHLSTDDKAAETVISVVGAGSTSVISSQLGGSFQDFLDQMIYCDELDGLGFLNVRET